MRSVRRLLPVLLPVAFLLGSCGDSYQVAARVGDLEITHDELAEKADAWAANDQLASQLGVSPSTKDGAAPQAVVAAVLSLDIRAEFARISLGDQADSPELAEVRSQVEQQLGELFAAFPEELRDETIDDFAVIEFASVNGVTPPDADVYVSPRYGEVDAAGFSVPAGPRPEPGGSAGSPVPPAPAAPSGS